MGMVRAGTEGEAEAAFVEERGAAAK